MAQDEPRVGPTIEAAESLSPLKIDYDVDAALSAGLTAADIADYLASETNYDVEGARSAGLSDDDIIEELSTARAPGKAAAALEGVSRGATVAAPAMGLGAAGAMKGLAAGTAIAPFLGPAAPLGPAAGFVAGGVGGAVLGGLLGAEAEDIFFPEEPVVPGQRPFLEAGKTLGAGVVALPAPHILARNVPLGETLFLREYAKSKGAEVMRATPGQRILETAATRPATFGISESAALGAASTAGGISEAVSPGDLYQRMGAEIVAGAVNPLRIASVAYGTAREALGKAVGFISPSQRQSRIGAKINDILVREGEDPEAVMRALREDDELAQMAAAAGVKLGPRTSAEKANSPTLSLLQNRYAENARVGPTIERARMENLNAVADMIRLMQVSEDPSLVAAAAKMRDQYMRGVMQMRLDQAVGKAAETAGKIMSENPDAGQRAGAVIDRLTRDALQDARDQEQQLYARVDQLEEVNPVSIIGEYNSIRSKLLPEAPFPSLITRFVARAAGEDGEVTTVDKELAATISRVQTRANRAKDRISELEARSPEAGDVFYNSFRATGSLEGDIAELGRIASDYRQKGKDAVGGYLDSTTRNRVAQLAENQAAMLRAQSELTELRRNQAAPTVVEGEEGPTMTVGDLTKFRSEMLSMARDARASSNFRDANFYGRMAEAALNDLGIRADEGMAEGVSQANRQALQDAHAFSRALNDTFSRAFGGDILSKRKSGADALPPELIADRVLGGSSDATSLKLAQLEDVATFMARNAGEDFADTAAQRLGTMRGAQETILRLNAEKSINPDTGQVSILGLRRFVRDNALALQKFPGLQQDLSDAVLAAKLVKDTQNRNSVLSQKIDAQRAFRLLLDNSEDPGLAVAKTIGSPGSRPSDAVKGLKVLARTARSGGEQAKLGLFDAVLDRAFLYAGGADGQLNFQKFADFLTKPMSRNQPSVMSVLREMDIVSDVAATNLNRLAREGTRIEQILAKGGPKLEDELSDTPGAVADMIIRITGSTIGTSLGRITQRVFPGRGQGIVEAQAGVRAATNLFEKMPQMYFTDMVTKAINEPEFMAMLMDKAGPVRQPVRFGRQLNAYLVNAGLSPSLEEIRDIEQRMSTGLSDVLPRTEEQLAGETEQYLRSIISPEAQTRAPRPARAPVQRPAPTPPPRPAPVPRPAAPPPPAPMAAPSRAGYAAMFPNDPISSVIQGQQAAQPQGIESLMPR